MAADTPLRPTGPTLHAESVRNLRQSLDSASAGAELDLGSIEQATPRGLAALAAWAEESDGALTLTGLSRPLTRSALQLGLHEHALILPDPEQLADVDTPWAVLHQSAEAPDAGQIDLAGRPLLTRQLQWLLDQGVARMVVEVGASAVQRQLGEWLLSDDPLAARAKVVLTSGAVGPDEVARRGGLSGNPRFVAIPGDCVGDVALDWLLTSAQDGPLQARCAAPGQVDLPTATLEVRHLGSSASPNSTRVDGWACTVRTRADGLRLANAALAEQLTGIEVHAAQAQPGVWLARGATVSPQAEITAPAYVGSDSMVAAGARVGPRAVVGDNCVIERAAVLQDGVVASNTILGESVRVEDAYADAEAFEPLDGGARRPPDSALALDPRTAPASASLSARLVGLVLLLFLAIPWLLAAALCALRGKRAVEAVGAWSVGNLASVLDVVPALWDVLRGQRDLVGVADASALRRYRPEAPPQAPLRAGAIDITESLAPGGSAELKARMWRWYVQHKAPRVDLALLLGRDEPVP